MKTFAQFFFCMVLFSTGLRAADWPQFRGPNRDGVCPDQIALIRELPEGGLQPVWTYRYPLPPRGSNRYGSSGIVIADGRCHVFAPMQTQAGKEGDPLTGAICLDARTGKLIWQQALKAATARDKWAPSATPCVDDGVMYLATGLMDLLAFDAQTGELLWRLDQRVAGCKYNWHSSPVVIGDEIWYIRATRGLTAVSKTTRTVVWCEADHGRDFAPPVSYKKGTLLIGDLGFGDKCGALFSSPIPIVTDDGYDLVYNAGVGLRCIDTATRKQKWFVALPINRKQGGSSPVLAEGYVALPYNEEKAWWVSVAKVDANTATLSQHTISDKTATGLNGGSAVIKDGHVYAIHPAGKMSRLLRMRLTDGATSASVTFTGDTYTSPIWADGLILITCAGMLHAFDTTDANLNCVFQADINCYRYCSPSIADGFLYVRTEHGIACYDLRKNQAPPAEASP